MPINFKEVPTDNPYTLTPKGLYKFKVMKAELKKGKVTSENPNPKAYINATLSLTNPKGQKTGNFFDMFSESTHEISLYKIGRFCKAIGLSLTGSVELKDLVKLLPNREGCLMITHQQDRRYPNDDTKQKAVVDLFGSEGYWPLSEFPNLIKDRNEGMLIPDEPAAEGEDTSFEFTAGDGETGEVVDNDEL